MWRAAPEAFDPQAARPRVRPLRALLHGATVAALLAAAFPVHAQDALMDRIRSGLRGIARGVDYVGQKADDLLGPGLNRESEPAAEHTEERTFTQRYPVDESPVVAISNQFGEIRVEAWADAVVQIEAKIVVGAESTEVARKMAEATAIQVTPSQEVVEAHTGLPEVGREMGAVSTRVDYTVSVPVGANLVLENFFGDTLVRGTSGLAAIESQYGAVSLNELKGQVNVRAHGDFPLEARALEHGGSFELNGSQARFSGVQGNLRVHAFRGSVEIAGVSPDASVEALSESGSIKLLLPTDARPDLTATVQFGNLQSALELTRTTMGRRVLGRYPAEAPAQRISLSARFGDIAIEQELPPGEAPKAERAGAKPFTDSVSATLPCAADAELQVRAMKGDVRIEAAQTDKVEVTASRVVWMERPLDAPAALNALALQTDQGPGRCTITTLATSDMAEIGCAAWQVNLVIKVPPALALRLEAAEGNTILQGLGAAANVTQGQGSLRAADCTGTLELSNQNGEVVVDRPGAKVTASALYGDCVVSEAKGPLDLQCREGKTIVDGAAGDVTVRGNGGDVRIIALNGVGGAYDVRAENATLRMLLAPTADAAITALTTRGEVHSVHALQGSVNGDAREFHGRLNQGANAVRLEAIDGDVYLD